MKKELLRSIQIGISVGLILTGCSSPFSQEKESEQGNRLESLNKPYVVLVSIDGYRSDYTDLYSPPTLTQLKQKGASTEGLLPVYPSKTFTNHYSIATGLYAENHGIVANQFYDPIRREAFRASQSQFASDGSWFSGIPLWVAAEKQGMVSACYFWPGSEAKIHETRPSYFHRYNGKVSNSQRVQTALEWLSLPPKKRPHFITLYFSDVDTAGHDHGPRSLELRQAVSRVDQAITELKRGLESLPFEVNLVIVSDHGMQELDSKKVEYLDNYTDLTFARLEGDGPQILIYSEDTQKLEKAYSDLKARAKHFKVYRRSELPTRFHYSKNPRSGDLIAVAEAPYSIGVRPTFKMIAGNHGFDPDITPSMRGIFYASGPQIHPAQIPTFRNIHIYPLVMKILDLQVLEPIDGDGKVLGVLYRSSSSKYAFFNLSKFLISNQTTSIDDR
jgi:predicted AlkP superfamily pyrophosphatase or phosphodiesterase